MIGQPDEQDLERWLTADLAALRDDLDRVVPPTGPPDPAASDAELIEAVRGGAISAYGRLFERHVDAARNLARALSRSTAEADDLVSDAFAKVLDVLRAGRGPDSAFRAYLFTALRHTAYDRTRREKPLRLADDVAAVAGVERATTVPFHDPALATLERFLASRAFASLPERWQTVLWQIEIEGQSPAQVAPLLGLSSNGVSALAHRAREGLKKAYLQAHLAHNPSGRCRATVTRLGAWTRRGLTVRENAQVQAHLDGCVECRGLAAELADVNGTLRAVVAPLVLGAGAGGYLAGTAGAAKAGPVAATVSHWVAAGAATTAAATALVWSLGAAPQVAPNAEAGRPPATTTLTTAATTSSNLLPTAESPAPTTSAPTSGTVPSTGSPAGSAAVPTTVASRPPELVPSAPAGFSLGTGGPPTDLPITVRNAGTTPVAAPALVLSLPDGVQVVGPGNGLRRGPLLGLDGAQPRIGCPAGKGTVTCSADRALGGGESAVFVLRLLAGPKATGGSITGTVGAGPVSAPVGIPVEIRPKK